MPPSTMAICVVFILLLLPLILYYYHGRPTACDGDNGEKSPSSSRSFGFRKYSPENDTCINILAIIFFAGFAVVVVTFFLVRPEAQGR